MAKHKSGELRCPATALIAYAKIRFSHDAAHIEADVYKLSTRIYNYLVFAHYHSVDM